MKRWRIYQCPLRGLLSLLWPHARQVRRAGAERRVSSHPQQHWPQSEAQTKITGHRQSSGMSEYFQGKYCSFLGNCICWEIIFTPNTKILSWDEKVTLRKKRKKRCSIGENFPCRDCDAGIFFHFICSWKRREIYCKP